MRKTRGKKSSELAVGIDRFVFYPLTRRSTMNTILIFALMMSADPPGSILGYGSYHESSC